MTDGDTTGDDATCGGEQEDDEAEQEEDDDDEDDARKVGSGRVRSGACTGEERLSR